jgi:transcriptional antiterminator Rof (Rho-off)
MTDYRPVDCTLHSEYELAIMQRRRLHLTWLGNDDTTCIEVVMPTDLYTRQGEEYMVVVRSNGQVENIRLDHIIGYHHV